MNRATDSYRRDAERSAQRSARRRAATDRAPRGGPNRSPFSSVTRMAGRRRRRRIKLGAGAVTALVAAGLGAGAILFGEEVSQTVSDTLREAVTLPLRHDDIIRQQAADKDVDAALIAAVIYSESRFQDQTSSAGARGLMQITPATAEEIEKLSGGSTFTYDDLADPDLNIRYGTFYLRHLLTLYDENKVAALAAYNAGPANADEWGATGLRVDDIEFEETREYVTGVLEKRDEYRQHYASELGFEK